MMPLRVVNFDEDEKSSEQDNESQSASGSSDHQSVDGRDFQMEGSAQKSLGAPFPSDFDERDIEEEKKEEGDIMAMVPDAQREQIERQMEMLQCKVQFSNNDVLNKLKKLQQIKDYEITYEQSIKESDKMPIIAPLEQIEEEEEEKQIVQQIFHDPEIDQDLQAE